MTTKYIGKYADGGSKNSFYKMKGSRYGFKSFPNKSLAEFAHHIQSELSEPCTFTPRVYSPVCRIRIPNYFAVSDGKGGDQFLLSLVPTLAVRYCKIVRDPYPANWTINTRSKSTRFR